MGKPVGRVPLYPLSDLGVLGHFSDAVSLRAYGVFFPEFSSGLHFCVLTLPQLHLTDLLSFYLMLPLL